MIFVPSIVVFRLLSSNHVQDVNNNKVNKTPRWPAQSVRLYRPTTVCLQSW